MASIQLHDIPLFSEMDEDEIRGIRAIMAEIKFKPKQIIIREGETGDLFYIITAGHAQIIINDADGEEVILREIGPGGFFGELSMLTNEPRAARVQAIDPKFRRTYRNGSLDDFRLIAATLTVDSGLAERKAGEDRRRVTRL